MTIVAFRKENEKLTNICMETFKNSIAAKKHIEEDAAFFCMKHPGAIDLGWIKPNTLDYYCVQMKNGTMCYWQYFDMNR